MRAVIMRRFGPPGVLEPVAMPSPAPGPGEVAVDVEFAGVTFVETQIRAGRPPRPEMLPALPAILGNGVGGTVAEGRQRVDPGLVGRRVVASLNGTGEYASRTVADAARLLEVPGRSRGAQRGRAACGRAHGALARRGRRAGPGDTVLVEAAAGGVGTLLVQLARNAGALVVGLARGERKLEVIQELGADVAVDYADGDWPRVGSRCRRRCGRGLRTGSAGISGGPRSACCGPAAGSVRSAWRAVRSRVSRGN